MANFSDKEAEVLNRLKELARQSEAEQATQSAVPERGSVAVPMMGYDQEQYGIAYMTPEEYRAKQGPGGGNSSIGPEGFMEQPRESKALPPQNTRSGDFPPGIEYDPTSAEAPLSTQEVASILSEEEFGDVPQPEYNVEDLEAPAESEVVQDIDQMLKDKAAELGVEGEYKPEAPAEEPTDPREKVRKQVMEKYGIKEPTKPGQEELRRAQEQARIGELIANLGQASDTVTSAMGGVPGSPEYYEAMRKQAQRPVEEINQQIALAKEQRQAAKDEQEAAAADVALQAAMDEKEYKENFRNPDSKISQIYKDAGRKVMEKYNIPVDEEALKQESAASVSDFMKSYTPFAQLFQSEINAKRKAELDTAKQQQKAEKEASKKSADWQKERRKRVPDIRKEAQKLPEAKDISKIYSQREVVQNAINNPGAFGDIASVFGFMKGIDPESVVRESEFENAAGAGSLLTNFKNKWGKTITGEFLQQAQREEILAIVDLMLKASRDKYAAKVQPMMREVIGTYNMDPRLVFSDFDTETASSIAQEYGKTLDDLDTDLSPGARKAEPSTKEEPAKASSQDEAARKWLRENPDDPRADAIRKKLESKGISE